MRRWFFSLIIAMIFHLCFFHPQNKTAGSTRCTTGDWKCHRRRETLNAACYNIMVVVHPIWTRERNRSWRRRQRAHRSYAWLILEEAPTTFLDGDQLSTGHSLIRSTPFLPGWKTHSQGCSQSSVWERTKEGGGEVNVCARVCVCIAMQFGGNVTSAAFCLCN